MRRTLTAIVTATTIVAATALPAGAAEPDELSPSSVTWEGTRRTDPIADSGGGADVDEFRMSYDSATDEFVVEARILDVPVAQWGFGVYLDLDRDRMTGCDGADRLVAVQLTGGIVTGQSTTELEDCEGTPSSPMPVSAEFLPAFGYMSLRIPGSLLGSPVSVDWLVVVPTVAGGLDFAPDPPGAMNEEFGWVRPFADVRTDAFYSGPIAWLRQSGLSTGIGSTGNYDPDGPVSRAQMATFIWRIAGEPSDPPAPFTDIQRPSFYAAAVDWFYDAGLTTGVGGSNRFAPNDPVTRAQMVTFLWRYAGEPTGYPASGFDDVTNPSAYYYDAIAFAKAEGITTGIGGTNEFRPDEIVTRGQLATFLQRYFAPLGTPTFVP